MKRPFRRPVFALAYACLLSALVRVSAAENVEGVRRVQVLNYADCVELFNDSTIVTLGHQTGGRVLRYALNGDEALYLDPREARWTPESPESFSPISAGRFDIGPENLIPRRPKLWSGRWDVEVIGPRAARMTSQEDAATGVQLIREFQLAPDSSHLSCRQIIRNVSDETKRWSHWSRTFAKHGGIVIIPLDDEPARLPARYVMYERGGLVNFRPRDEAVRVREGFLEVLRPTEFPKLGMDSFRGWFAYQMPEDLLFVKRYETFPDAVYNDLAGITISIWYPNADVIPACELEPIGPRMDIGPGEAAAFTEHWWLLENEFPAEGEAVDLDRVASLVEGHTSEP